jgi:transposase
VEVVHRRCAGIDISKKDAKVYVRVQGSGRRATTASVTTWGAMSNEILALREHLIAEKVTCVVMESTGDYWKPFYNLLEDAVNVMLVNSDPHRCGMAWHRSGNPRAASNSGLTTSLLVCPQTEEKPCLEK